MDKPQGPIPAWIRKLGPFKTLSERTFEHASRHRNWERARPGAPRVERVRTATAGIGPASIASRSKRRPFPPDVGGRERGWKDYVIGAARQAWPQLISKVEEKPRPG